MTPSFRREPFLWIHLSGIGMVPVCLGLGIVFLAMGQGAEIGGVSLFSVTTGWGLGLLLGLGTLPVLLMQLFRPFDIFSILLVSLHPDRLTPERRCILRLFCTRTQKIVTLVTAGIWAGMLWVACRFGVEQMGTGEGSWVWLVLGMGVLMLGHLFLQVPMATLQVLLRSRTNFSQVEPYPVDEIYSRFTIPGIRVEQITPVRLFR